MVIPATVISAPEQNKTPANTGVFLRFCDSTSIILDPSVDGSNHTQDTTNATWSTTFPNNANGGTVSGIASCNSISGTWGQAYPEYNNQITQGYQSGQGNCWCRMTSPVRSAWAYLYTYPASDCATTCATGCSYTLHNNIEFRNTLFDSAGN